MNKLLLGAAIIICIVVAGGALYLNKGDNMQNFAKTDADFTAMWNHFLENDVKPHGNLDTQMRYLTVLAAHIATQSVNEYKLILAQALDDEVSPIAVKEEKHPRWKALGWTLLETIDPTYERPGDFVNHETKFDKYRTDDL